MRTPPCPALQHPMFEIALRELGRWVGFALFLARLGKAAASPLLQLHTTQAAREWWPQNADVLTAPTPSCLLPRSVLPQAGARCCGAACAAG